MHIPGTLPHVSIGDQYQQSNTWVSGPFENRVGGQGISGPEGYWKNSEGSKKALKLSRAKFYGKSESHLKYSRISSLPSPWLLSRFLYSFLFLHKLPTTNSLFHFSQLRLLSYTGFLLPHGLRLPLSLVLLAFRLFQYLCLLILLLPLFL